MNETTLATNMQKIRAALIDQGAGARRPSALTQLEDRASRIKDRATYRFGQLMAKAPASPTGAAVYKSKSGGRPTDLETRADIQERLDVSDHQVKQARARSLTVKAATS